MYNRTVKWPVMYRYVSPKRSPIQNFNDIETRESTPQKPIYRAIFERVSGAGRAGRCLIVCCGDTLLDLGGGSTMELEMDMIDMVYVFIWGFAFSASILFAGFYAQWVRQ